jgi:hypothetical protein
VDASAPEPGSLIEAVPGTVRELRLRTYLEDAALRRGAAEWQFELGRLVKRPEAKPPDADRHLQVEPSGPRWPGHLHERGLRAPDLATQGALIEAIEARTSPPPPGNGQQAGDRSNAAPGACDDDDRGQAGERGQQRQANEIRQHDPGAQRGKQ